MDNNQKKLKKRILIAISVILVVIIVLFVASILIDKYYDNQKNEESAPIDYNFYEADYDEYIYNDDEYFEKIEYGFISYTDSNLTLGINRENAINYGAEVDFMVKYLYSIINGNCDEYNSYFSDLYYEKNDKHDRFTMQKIYDVNIEKKYTTISSENGADYTKYEFVLEYRIFKNNGTFRNDIGDGSKKQYITVTDRDGSLLIDSISTAKYSQQK